MTRTGARRPPVTSAAHPHYQWVVVAAVFSILGVTSGLGFYNASVILSAATRELGVSVGAVSGATAVFFAVGGLSGFALSPLLDRADVRWFYVTGGLAGAVALYGLRWVTNAVELYVFFALFGVGFGLAGLVPGTTLITRWFAERRSVALSIASTGLSVGGIVLTPGVALLITDRGLSEAGAILAAGWLVGIVPIAVLALRPRPQQSPAPSVTSPSVTSPSVNGESETATATDSSTPTNSITADTGGLTFAQARTSRYFKASCVAYVFIYFGQVGALAHVFNLVRERVDTATAASALSAVALCSIVARLIGGVVLLRVPTRLMAVILAANQGVALIMIGWASGAPGLLASIGLFGASVGNLLMIQPLLMAEAFGSADYSRIYSLNQLISTIGVASGPLVLGLVHDVVNYRAAFVLAASAALGGTAALVLTGPSPHRPVGLEAADADIPPESPPGTPARRAAQDRT